MYAIGKAAGYRSPLIMAAGISAVLGVVAVMLLTGADAGNSQAVESPPTQISEPNPTAFVATNLDAPGAVAAEPAPSEPLVAPASECGSDASVETSLESGESGLIVMAGTVSAGGLLSVPIVLSHAPAGLAGYDVRLSVADPSIARLARIDFPNFGLAREVEASEQHMRIAAADLLRVVEVGDSDSTLAVVTVEGAGRGATSIELTIIRMDDDSGDPMTPQVYSGTVTVC